MQNLGFGTTFRATATGFTTITSAAARVLGIIFTGSGTGSITLYSCKSTASATASTALCDAIVAYATVAGATVNQAVYFPFPASADDGVTISIGASADPKLTLFYSAA